ncbi:PepSY domain-containing protein [Candidatus Woesearchaeota archaeon]|nr:PepSY domain-containing protein [Candidatus Woesearchaeota archaeon]
MKKIMILLVCVILAGCANEAAYSPEINPADFSSVVTNKYFTLTPGTNMVYLGDTEDGLEAVEVYVTNEKKIVMGVETVVVWDRVWLNGELIEDTKDWYAQDRQGNVWYFGEDSMELAGGKVTSRKGSWEAGVKGALPGIVMKASPRVGESYRQEYAKGEAEDMADVVSIAEKVSVEYGNFTGCIKTRDYTPLEPDVEEFKYYCPQVGLVLELAPEENERLELVQIELDSEEEPLVDENEPEDISVTVTEEDAKQTALRQVQGTVTDVSIETKYGIQAYVVEVRKTSGEEVDVVIDIETGEIVNIEE